MSGLAEIVRLPDLPTAAWTAADILPASPRATTTSTDVPADHVAHCLRCQAELADTAGCCATCATAQRRRSTRRPARWPPLLAALEAGGTQPRPEPTAGCGPPTSAGSQWRPLLRARAGVLVWMNRRRVGLAATG